MLGLAPGEPATEDRIGEAAGFLFLADAPLRNLIEERGGILIDLVQSERGPALAVTLLGDQGLCSIPSEPVAEKEDHTASASKPASGRHQSKVLSRVKTRTGLRLANYLKPRRP